MQRICSRVHAELSVMVASIGKIGSLSRGVGYFEKDGYYARDDPGAPGGSEVLGGQGR